MLNDEPHPTLLDREHSAVLVVDVQGAFASYIDGFDELVERAGLLLRIATLLGVPVAASEQYPRGLGSTVEPLVTAAGGALATFGKVEFAASTAASWQTLPSIVRDAHQFVLVGIEAHVCVRHTALALHAAGRQVHVAVDAIGSARTLHRDVAIRELTRAGIVETSVEQAAFDWLRRAGTPEFQAVQRLLIG